MQSKLFILGSVLFLSALILGGCGPSKSQEASVDVSCDDFTKLQSISKEIEVAVDSSFTVTLCSNPTTGFQWESAKISDQTVLEQIDHQFVSPKRALPPPPGTAGQEVWTFKVLKAGKSTISIEYSQPWEGGEKAAWTYALTVLVNQSGASPTPTTVDLDGTEWVLTSLNSNTLIEGTEISLYFEGASLGGSMTCNGYGGGRDSGKYIATDEGTLTIPMIAVTLQLCSEPEGLMEQEAAYIEALQDAASYRVMGDRLEIANPADKTTLVFARRADAAVQAPDDIRGARDSALAYVSEHHGQQAPPPGLTWTEEDATPEGLIGWVTYEFKAEDWVVTIGHAVVPPEMRVYQVGVANQATGFQWEGRIDAQELATEGPEIVLTARDASLNYISEHYGELAPPPDLTWEGGRATPEGLVGGETFQYTAADWVVTITYPVVAPENVVYHIVVANSTTGFQWEGELDAERYLTETAAPEGYIPPQVMLDRISARDAALNYVFEQYRYPPVESLYWEEERITPEGLVGAETYRYTAFDWVAEISYNVVAPAAVIYQVKVTNPALGLEWEGEVDAAGQVTEQPASTGGIFQPLSPTACNDLASAMAQTLGVEAATAETPFQDYISRKTGASCQATATGTGLDFEDYRSVAEDLKGMLEAQGWQEDISYMADGPTGTGGGFRKANGLCLLMVGWEPSEDADCPTDKPIGLCELSPEQQLYTITLNCAQDTSTEISTTTPTEKQRVTAPDVAPSDLADLVNGNSAFAFDLYQALAEEDGNLFCSPYSISLALAMTYAGARGETEHQMADALHFILSQDHLHPAFNALDLELARRGESAKGKDSEGFRLNIVNAIWGQEGYKFLSEFLDALAENYGAGLRPLDFVNAPEESRVAINDWVSEQTEGRIEDLIPKGIIDALTRLVLTNAIYFNAAWSDPFEPELTGHGTFHLLDGSEVTAPMMQQTESFGYAEGEGYQAVELPYDGHELSMVILLPEAGGFETFEGSLDAERVAAIVKELAHKRVALTMPKFEFESSFSLKDTLAAMGMAVAFSGGADFSGMSGNRDLFIAEVIHKAFVSVDEAGTEAAAATAVVMRLTAAPEKPIEVTLDRPFVFLIRDIETGSILFVGRVVNPIA